MIKIGINGFGRIGRTLFKLISERADMEVCVINDPADETILLNLLKLDSVHGRFRFSQSGERSGLRINNTPIRFYSKRNPEEIKWNEHDLDFIVECSGKFKTKETLTAHLQSKKSKVILAVPPADDSIKMVVYGVNEDCIVPSDRIISNASCTTNSAAHLINILHSKYELRSCFITTIHSYTTDQNLQDSPHRDLRRARAAAQSIIPTSTGAAKALTKIFPHLENVIGGCGIRVPVPDGSLTDLTFSISNPPSESEVNALILEASGGSLNGILEYSDVPLVSTDVIGNRHSCVFNSDLTSVVGDMVKLVGWYDNEMGYSSRLVDLMDYVHGLS